MQYIGTTGANWHHMTIEGAAVAPSGTFCPNCVVAEFSANLWWVVVNVDGATDTGRVVEWGADNDVFFAINRNKTRKLETGPDFASGRHGASA